MKTRLGRFAPPVFLVILCVWPGVGAAQPAPVGPSFRVDPRPDGDFSYGSSIAMAPDGRTVIAWSAGFEQIVFRVFDVDGTSRSPVVAIPEAVSDVAAVAAGRGETFVVTWRRRLAGRPAAPWAYQGRRYRFDGGPDGDVFTLASTPERPEVDLCAFGDGRFVAVWNRGDSVWVRRFERSDVPLGPARLVDSDPGRYVHGPRVACAGDGRFVVAWSDLFYDDVEFRARVFAADGRPVTGASAVNVEPISGSLITFGLAMAPSGRFVFVWWQSPAKEALARFFAADGRPLGAPVRLEITGLRDEEPHLAALAHSDGDYTLLWSELDPRLHGVWRVTRYVSQVYDAYGSAVGEARPLTRAWRWVRASFAGDGLGHLAMTWADGRARARFFNAVDPGRLELSARRMVAGEGTKNAAFTVSRLGGSAGRVSVDYFTRSHSARHGRDFVATLGTLRFDDQVSEPRKVRVPLLNDTTPEELETLTFTLRNPTGGAELGDVATTVLEIRDDDVTPVRMPGPPLTVSGGTDAPYYFDGAPAVALGGDGALAVAWREGGGALARVFASGVAADLDLGYGDWGPPAATTDPDGGFAVLWQVASSHMETRLHRFLEGEGWEVPSLLYAGPPAHSGPADYGPWTSQIELAKSTGRGFVLLGDLDGFQNSLVLQRFSAAGELAEPARPIGCAEPCETPERIALAVAADGTALALWSSGASAGESVVEGAWSGPDPSSGEETFRVSGDAPGFHQWPAVAALGKGRFLAVWQSLDDFDRGTRISGRVILPRGKPPGPVFQISTLAAGDQVRPRIAAAGGMALVVWERLPPTGGPSRLRAQLLDSQGRLVGREFAIPSAAGGAQGEAAVAADESGRFAVVWTERGAITEPVAVYGRKLVEKGVRR